MSLNAYQSIKRFLDILLAIASGLILSPLILLTAIMVKLSCKGSIFFLQERVGLNMIPFMIWKFRSMYITAEETGPQLSSDDDNRVTAWGKIMRKWRLDELPQLYNVLNGDMSIVGPRPERKFYIDQIVKTHPQYLNLLKVKPGITSLGMVKFGYAENVEEMIKRMKFDLDYVEDPSIGLDIKIMLQSIKVVFAGKGK
jgi:lipopolysaccharide/colanic/teichoic acid biosynthesis glycosyltransferase